LLWNGGAAPVLSAPTRPVTRFAAEDGSLRRAPKHYVWLQVVGAPHNFVSFMPRKGHLIMAIKLAKSLEIDPILTEAEISTLNYEGQFRQHRIRFDSMPEGKQKQALAALIQKACESYGRGW